MKTAENSSEILLRRYSVGSERAAFELFDRYRLRIIGLARKHLAGFLSAKVDVDDISQETFQAFFALADQGDIRWQKRGDLWRLLAGIAVNKTNRSMEYFGAAKRDVARESTAAATSEADRELYRDAQSAVEELNDMVEALISSEKPLMRNVLTMRLAGYSQSEIASRIGRTTRTVRRMLDSLKAKVLLQRGHGLEGQFGPDFGRSIDSSLHHFSSGKGSSPISTIQYSRIQLLRMIGQGSFSKVYLARQCSSDRFVAVKCIRKKWLDNVKVRETFKAEAELLGRLEDPNVIRLLGVGDLPNGACFLMLEYVEGENWNTAISTGSANRILHWLHQLWFAIERLHFAGICHGDLRPDNVLIDDEGNVRLVDFGLGHWLDPIAGRDFSEDVGGAIEMTEHALRAASVLDQPVGKVVSDLLALIENYTPNSTELAKQIKLQLEQFASLHS